VAFSFRQRSLRRGGRGGRDGLGGAAIGQADLDDEGISAVNGGRPGDGGVELALDLLVQARENGALADGRQAVGGRGHQLRGLEGLIKRLGLVAHHVLRPLMRVQAGFFANLLGGLVETREKSPDRKPLSQCDLVSWSILSIMPSSMP